MDNQMAAAAVARQLGLHLVPEAAVEQAFRECSEEARGTLEALQLTVGETILREDVAEVLCRVAGRDLTGAELAATLKCFLLDVSATMGWAEFQRSWSALHQLGAEPQSANSGGAYHRGQNGRRRAPLQLAAPPPQQGLGVSQPLTAQQEIGWHHALAPLAPKVRNEDLAARHVPLRGSDVTRGGEGQSAATYFGMYL